MKLVAVTGSIGCGKTTISRIIRDCGYVVFDVDAWVRRLYYKKSFIAKVIEIFPMTCENGVFNKRKLRNWVFSDNKELKKLEDLIHPFLRKYLKLVINKCSRKQDCFFIDVALLYEMNWDIYCDFVVVADVDYEIQKKRVMLRDNISADDFDKINNVQMSNEKKKEIADFVINTDKKLNLLKLDVIRMINMCEEF